MYASVATNSEWIQIQIRPSPCVQLTLLRRVLGHSPIRLKFSEQLYTIRKLILCFYTYIFLSHTVIDKSVKIFFGNLYLSTVEQIFILCDFFY